MTVTDIASPAHRLPRPRLVATEHLPSLIVALAIGVMLGLFIANAPDYAARLQASQAAAAAQPTPEWHGNVRRSVVLP
ncbi:hypothetical protein [Vannielia litorea]|uniref:hypothetical protein n=1 Tax=Vannielia litorea TaxID=1217970 RepID=UPI001C95D868|nr:hypothetical protein [Vannielia litorea]MBY6049094.1 hypothetical protein [Vannielia litorea]MBY6076508.1 hypothetical protein [Vannielia litorea]